MLKILLPIWDETNTIKIINKGQEFSTYKRMGDNRNSYCVVLVNGNLIDLEDTQYTIDNNNNDDDSYFIHEHKPINRNPIGEK